MVSSAPPRLFFEENFRELEAATRQLSGVGITDECHTFLADFGKVDFPSKLGQLIGVDPWTR